MSVRLSPALALAVALTVNTACGSGPQQAPADAAVADVQDAADLPGDDADPEVATDTKSPTGLCPAGFATLTFSVDDSANQTYGAGELIWTGSFAWDEATNTLQYATSWLPEEGPYPTLHDDGPRSEGGHEPEGATAGDHVFGVAVCYQADQDRTFAYGALNDDLRWIWVGPNGVFDIPKGSTEVIDVPGMTITPHGDRDFRVHLDMAGLHPDFEGVDLATYRVWVKGTMNAWTPIQLLDDGANGDAAAGDGVVTYQHSRFLGAHDGLLAPGQEAQFVFVFTKGETDPDAGLEYKVDGDAVLDGVSAAGLCGGAWVDHPVALALDSKGKSMNTAVVACPGDEPTPECGPGNPCATPNTHCVDGACVPDTSTGEAPELHLVVPSTGGANGGTAVTLHGEGFTEGATVTFGGAQATVVSLDATQIAVTTPPGSPGKVDVEVTLADGASATYPQGFTYVDAAAAPTLTGLSPSSGPMGGGTQVTLNGANLATVDSVLFGTATATDVEAAADGTWVKATTPAAPIGSVSVTVTTEDGQKATLASAFSFVAELPDWGQLLSGAQLSASAGQPSAIIEAQVYEGGVTDQPGAGFGLTAEVGYGPWGTDPTANDGWDWSSATYSHDVGNDDVWSASLIAPTGVWAVTLRFSVNGGTSWLYVDRDGADNGFDPAQVTKLTVAPAGPVSVTALEPATVSPLGGVPVQVSGAGFEAGCTVSLDDLAVSPTDVDVTNATTLTVLVPAHPPGSAELTVTCDAFSAAGTLQIAGAWDGDLGEWPASSLLATATTASAWGPDDNHLQALHAATDGQTLYVAVQGFAHSDLGQNAITVYVDADYGSGTGLTSTAALESDGAVDDALGGVLTFDIDGFGAEVAFAAIEKASYLPAVDDPAAKGAGWRGLAPAQDLPWLLDGAVISSAQGLEAYLPLQVLFGPPTGALRTVALVARLGTADGAYLSNQSLPQGTSGSAHEVSTEAATLTLVW